MAAELSCYPTLTLSPSLPFTKEKVDIALQRQRAESDRGAANPIFNYVVDVPISENEVERRETQFRGLADVNSHLQHQQYAASPFPSLDSQLVLPVDERRKAVHKFAPFPLFDVQAVKSLPASRLLKMRREWLPYRQQFAIQNQRTNFLDAVLNHSVIGVVGGTGTGKTLQVPIILSETDAFKRKRIVVVAPNEAAVILTAARLREERGEDAKISRAVAAVTPFQRDAGEGTSIVVTTPEMLLRQLLSDPTLVDVVVVVFDDVHIRDESTEMCFFLLRNVLLKSEEIPFRVVVSSVEETAAASVLEFFKSQKCTLFTIASTTSSNTRGEKARTIPTSVLYLEEAVQWVKKCEKEGEAVCHDANSELAKYVEDVNVVASVLEIAEADFNDMTKLEFVWCSFARKCISHFDAADRKEHQQGGSSEDLSAIVVVCPNTLVMRKMAPLLDESKFVVTTLNEDTPSDTFFQVAGKHFMTQGNTDTRWVILTTPTLSQTVLPSSIPVGLVLDFARQSNRALELSSMADTCMTEFSSIQTLRNRRRPCSMIIQLIPKTVLHSVQQRKTTPDPNNHAIFHLPLERYVQLYLALLAIENNARESGNQNHAMKEGMPRVQRLVSLIPNCFIGTPALSSNRYDFLRRVLAQIENYLVANNSVEVANDRVNFRVVGVASFLIGLPLAISRLLLYAPIFNCRPEIICATAALCCVGDLFPATTDKEMQVLFNEARGYFSRDYCSDIVSSFNIYKMWLETKSKGEDAAFVEECGASAEKLLRISRLQVALWNVGRHLGLLTSDDADANVDERALESKVEKCSDTDIISGGVKSCLSASFYPNCVVNLNDGTATLLDVSHCLPNVQDTTKIALTTRAAVFSNSSLLSSSGPSVSGAPFLYLGKRVAATEAGVPVAPVSILDFGIPLEEATAIVACGEGKKRVKVAPPRCRGWSSRLTDAWRTTSRARHLPPTAQLPATTIPVVPYDTIHSPNVVYSTDQNFRFTLRQTTMNWLLLFRKYAHLFFETLVYDKNWKQQGAFAAELREAWAWWERRQLKSGEWLREERQIAASASTGEKGISSLKLTPFYTFSIKRGLPVKKELPKGVTEGGASDANARREEEAEKGFQGKVPLEDVERMMKHLIRDLKNLGSRDLEKQVLHEDRASFSFVDAEDEYHDYYIYLLHQIAPELHELGDDEAELLEFLAKIEEEVKEEKRALAEAGGQSIENEEDHENEWNGRNVPKTQYHMEDITANVDNEVDGVQIEEATVNIRKHPAAGTTTATNQASAVAPTALDAPLEADPYNATAQPWQTHGDDQNNHAQQSAEAGNMNNTSTVGGVDMSGGLGSMYNPFFPLSGDAPIMGAEGMQPSIAELMSLIAPKTPENPLCQRPPPLPSKAVEEREPSVLVYPIPQAIGGGNIPLQLAVALGETLGMRVGPTKIVGTVARITVPNSKVELRALALKQFMCVGKTVHIFKNDRIIDNPELGRDRGRGRGRGGVGRGRGGRGHSDYLNEEHNDRGRYASRDEECEQNREHRYASNHKYDEIEEEDVTARYDDATVMEKNQPEKDEEWKAPIAVGKISDDDSEEDNS